MDASRADVAVVGCGHWGRNLVRILRELGALRAIVDRSPDGRDLARSLAPEACIHVDLDGALRDDRVRAVVISTPAETHYTIAMAALKAGRDVFVEKPLTTEVQTALELEQLAAANHAVLMVGHLLAYHPGYLALHRLVQEGTLGKIFYVVSNRLNLGKVRTEENALWSFAPHDISVILRLIGSMPLQVVSTGGGYLQPHIADVTVTQLLFDSGIRGHMFVSWLHPFKEQRMVVIGSDRMAAYDDVRKELLLYDCRVTIERGQPVAVPAGGEDVAFSTAEPLRAECEHFLRCTRTRQRPRTDARNGIQVLQVLEAAQDSLLANGRPAPVATKGRVPL